MLSQEKVIKANATLDTLKLTILAVLSFLSSMSLRDLYQTALKKMVSTETQELFLFSFASALFIVFITLLLAYLWQDVEA